ncbi:MAG TPA: hypothetical protein VIC08_13980 [Cellvibrionaceae bacterium]
MKKLSVLTLSLLFSLGSFSAMANDADFDRLDVNGDGSIDKQEAQSAGISDREIRELDSNGDGKLSKSEMKERTGRGTSTDSDTSDDSWQ